MKATPQRESNPRPISRHAHLAAAWQALALPADLLSKLLIAVVVLYQKLLSPLLRPCCRFAPSCSAYAIESLRKHGLVKGLAKTCWRLCRCHPLCEGGYDPP